jgi:hypothetical protein
MGYSFCLNVHGDDNDDGDVILLGHNTDIVKKNIDILTDDSKEVV